MSTRLALPASALSAALLLAAPCGAENGAYVGLAAGAVWQDGDQAAPVLSLTLGARQDGRAGFAGGEVALRAEPPGDGAAFRIRALAGRAVAPGWEAYGILGTGAGAAPDSALSGGVGLSRRFGHGRVRAEVATEDGAAATSLTLGTVFNF